MQVPVKLWCDTSTSAECDAIMDAFGGRRCLYRSRSVTRCCPVTRLPRFAGFVIRIPELYGRMDCVLLPHDYINFYLTGERCMEAGDASGTAFLNVRERNWSEAMLRAIDPDRDLRACLPEVPQLQRGYRSRCCPTVADELGLPASIPVATGGGDNMMGAIGTGNVVVRRGDNEPRHLRNGVRLVPDEPIVDPKGNIAAFCSSTGGWLPLLCTMNCTVTTELIRNVLDYDLEKFEAQLSASQARRRGRHHRAVFQRRAHTQPAQCQRIHHGPGQSELCARKTCCVPPWKGQRMRYGSGSTSCRRSVSDAEEIVLTGGGVNSPTWRQVVADICDAPVTVYKQEEGAAFGAALQALAMLEGPGLRPEVALR